jgi:hypothetical protein
MQDNHDELLLGGSNLMNDYDIKKINNFKWEIAQNKNLGMRVPELLKPLLQCRIFIMDTGFPLVELQLLV